MQNPSAQGVTTPTAVPGLSAPNAPLAPPGQGALPFRRAVGPVRDKISVTDSGTSGSATTTIKGVIPGTGYLCYLDMTVTLTSTGNASTNTVALYEDAPWSGLAAIIIDDGAAPFINMPGLDQKILSAYGGFGLFDDRASADTNVYNPISTGTGTGAGTGAWTVRIPFAINDRDLIGLIGNQDRQTKLNYETDIASTATGTLGPVFTTGPTNAPTYSITRAYGYVPVPGALSADRRPQEIMPAHYGTIHYQNSTQFDSVPAPSSTVNHFLRNLNNALRVLVLIFRAGTGATPRATAETNMPTKLTMYAGSDPVFVETSAERRWLMYHRYRFDVAPTSPTQGHFKGVLAYSALQDFGLIAGYELGNEYIYLGDLSEAQFEIVYPSGFTAGGTLRYATSTLALPPGLDPVTFAHA